MPHLPFIVAAYGFTFVALGGLLVWSLLRMRRAEKALEDGERR